MGPRLLVQPPVPETQGGDSWVKVTLETGSRLPALAAPRRTQAGVGLGSSAAPPAEAAPRWVLRSRHPGSSPRVCARLPESAQLQEPAPLTRPDLCLLAATDPLLSILPFTQSGFDSSLLQLKFFSRLF